MAVSRAIPPGYMTVGQIAKKIGVTVRTLQYYDREGLLAPSAESEGGRRLYTDQDVVRLHQILSMKHLGFSLDEIKNRLTALDTPADVAAALSEQAAALRKKIGALSSSLKDVEALQAEVLQMQQVDFKKYADIVVNLQMNNEFYWLIKYFDDQALDHFRSLFDPDSGAAMLKTYTRLFQEAVRLQRDGVPPESERGQEFAKAFWDMILEFTGGDMSMLPKLLDARRVENDDPVWKEQMETVNSYIEPALDAYFTRLGTDPLEGVAP